MKKHMAWAGAVALLLSMECTASTKEVEPVRGPALKIEPTMRAATRLADARGKYERALDRCEQERAAARPACRRFAKDEYDDARVVPPPREQGR